MPSHDPFSRRQLRASRRAWVRSNGRLLAALAAGAVALLAFATAGLMLMPAGPFKWWLMGAVHTGLIGTFFHLLNSAFLAFNGEAIWHVRGAWGEENTRDALAKAKRKKVVWGWVDSVSLNHGDIDHLVVTRNGGLVAIDSKWRNKIEDTADMARSAQKVKLRAEALTRDLLKGGARGSRRAKVNPLGVTPLVVLWGKAQHTVPDGAAIDGISFVQGVKLVEWLGRMEGQPVDKQAAEEFIRNVEIYRERNATLTT